ncbi:hypothetical protein PQ459_16220 [Chryseobacterium sp. KACC 21268]|nr:hypothetical protein PQ459_16220 [Chryseobacterium sp. KACC 21268]
MKTKTKQLLLAITMMLGVFVVITAFTKKPETKKTYYAFVTSFETDYDLDDGTSIITGIVSFDCERSDNNVKHQFLEHYNAEEATTKRQVFPNTTAAWIYNTYDEAVESRRQSLAKQKQNSKYNRTINFYVSCK